MNTGKGVTQGQGEREVVLNIRRKRHMSHHTGPMPDPRTVPGTGQGLRGEERFEEGVKGVAQL